MLMAHPMWGKQGYAINSPANTLVSWRHSSDCKVAEQEGFMKHELQSGILHVLHTAGLVLGLRILHVALMYLVSCPRSFSVVFWGLQEHVCSLPANAHSISVLQSYSPSFFLPAMSSAHLLWSPPLTPQVWGSPVGSWQRAASRCSGAGRAPPERSGDTCCRLAVLCS